MAASNPTAPLFAPSYDVLKAKLRLSGIKAGSDAEEILNDAIQTVRGGFYRRLGSGQLAKLVAISFTASPSTNDDYLRLIASNTEILWVRIVLLRTMPVLFRDSSGDVAQEWNDEGIIRELNAADLEDLIASLEKQLSDSMDILTEDESAGSETRVRVSTIGPEETPARPGATIFDYTTES